VKNIVILISGRGSNMEAIVGAGLPAKVAAVISNQSERNIRVIRGYYDSGHAAR
jgi:folate-dependent phosphoribosylglycinamide formyltransferase PurN